MRFVLVVLALQLLTLSAQAETWAQTYSHVDVGIQAFELLNERAKTSAQDPNAIREISLSIESFVKTGIWFSGNSTDPMALPGLATFLYQSRKWVAWEGTGKKRKLYRPQPSAIGSWLEAKHLGEIMAPFTVNYPRIKGVAPALADLIVTNFEEFAAKEHLYSREWKPASSEEFTRRIVLLNWVQHANLGSNPQTHVAKIRAIRSSLQSSAPEMNDPRMAAVMYFMQSDQRYGF